MWRLRMSNPVESLEARRARLVSKIAFQRSAFKQVFADLYQPIHVGEQACKGFGFLRRNSWIFSAIRILLQGISFVRSLRQDYSKSPMLNKELSRFERQKTASLISSTILLKWALRAWQAYRLYRRLMK